MRRGQGRVTRDDIRSAGLRRWDGRGRVTTDWVNIFHVCLPLEHVLLGVLHLTLFVSRNLSYVGQVVIVSFTSVNQASLAVDLRSESIPPSSWSKDLTRLWTAAWSGTRFIPPYSVRCQTVQDVTPRSRPKNCIFPHLTVPVSKKSSLTTLQHETSSPGFTIDPWLVEPWVWLLPH